MKKADEVVKQLVASENVMEAVLPELIKIASEGDEIDRTARLLFSKGWSKMDVWREIKKLPTVSDVFTMSLLNRFTDLERNHKLEGRYADDLRRARRLFKKS